MRLNAEHLEEIAADKQSACHARTEAAVEPKVDVGPCQHAGEDVLVIAKVLPQRIRERRIHRRPAAYPSRGVGQLHDRPAARRPFTGSVRMRMASSS